MLHDAYCACVAVHLGLWLYESFKALNESLAEKSE